MKERLSLPEKRGIRKCFPWNIGLPEREVNPRQAFSAFLRKEPLSGGRSLPAVAAFLLLDKLPGFCENESSIILLPGFFRAAKTSWICYGKR